MSTLAESPPTPSRRWRLPVTIAATLVLAATGFVFAQQRAEAVTIVQGTWYQLVNVHSNKLMEIAGNSTADGAMVQQYDNTGCQCQHFRFESAGTGWWRIVARHSGKAVDLWNWNTADGAEFRQWPITSGFNQQFSVQDVGGNAQFINRHSGKALEVWQWSTANAARVSQFADTNGNNQLWRLVAVGTGNPPPPPPPPPPAPPAGGLVGWATQGGGTTGGGSAAATTVTSSSALSSAVSGSTARVVRISGNISCSGMITVGSNKSILGNSGATLTGCGLNVSNASNVIIRNINFTGWNDDAINVQYSTRVWIDHNSLSNGSDGAIDIKRSSDFITVSWNRIFNHDKSMLLGHSDDNAGEDVGHLRVTYHHNWFDGTNQRHPRVRFGNPVHVYNNYYDAVGSYGVASTEGAGVLVEGNYFENTDDPYHLGEGDSGPGTLVARNNTFVNSGSGQAGGSVASIPYSYSLEASGNVKASVMAGAGAGRITV